MEHLDASPTVRALRALELLQARPGITATELAARLDVSDRAARRYVAVLRAAGVPVESERGPYGGYRLGRGHRPPPLVFTSTEVFGLVMAVLDGHHAAADPDEPVGSALAKLLAVVPPRVAAQAASLREHARAVPDRRASPPDLGVTHALVDAVAAHRGVRVTYRSESRSGWHAEVDPWAVVVRHGRWYLLCHSHRAAAERAYRIDRIERVEPLDTVVRPPDDLDPVAWLEEHLATGWPHATHVVFDAPIDDVAPWVPSPMGRLTPIGDGDRCEVRGTTGNPEMYAAEWLAAIPYPCTVQGGPELRAAVGAVAERLRDALDRAG